MDDRQALLRAALAARRELLSGGVSGAATYRVFGLAEPCVLKLAAAESPGYVRDRAQREIRFYHELAPRLPLRTPRLLASTIEPSGACALLLATYSPLPPASELRAADFAAIAAQLGGLHAAFWGRADRLAGLAWLSAYVPPDLSEPVRHARETWHALARRPQLRGVLPDAALRAIEAALEDVQKRPEHAPDAATTLCHGDCHLDNLLRDPDGALVWADWQEVRVGHGPSDLSFLVQRAEANGATVDHAALVAAYCAALASGGVAGISERDVAAAMRESERRTRLLFWPDYMADATAEQMARHLARIVDVVS